MQPELLHTNDKNAMVDGIIDILNCILNEYTFQAKNGFYKLILNSNVYMKFKYRWSEL